MDTAGYDRIEARYATLANDEDLIRSALVFGSRARVLHQADQWSDLDLMAFTPQPGYFLEQQEWISRIGAVSIPFVQTGVFGSGVEIRILFELGLDVDFLFLPHDDMAHLISGNEISGWLESGYRVLADKDGKLASLLRLLAYRKGTTDVSKGYSEYRNLVGDFFFHVVWSTKKLCRGEVLVAKSCCDVYMKELLLRMVRWTDALRHPERDPVPYGQRFLERWADPDVVEELSHTYAPYDAREIESALDATAAMFSRLAKEVATRMRFAYPAEYERSANDLVSGYRKARI